MLESCPGMFHNGAGKIGGQRKTWVRKVLMLFAVGYREDCGLMKIVDKGRSWAKEDRGLRRSYAMIEQIHGRLHGLNKISWAKEDFGLRKILGWGLWIWEDLGLR